MTINNGDSERQVNIFSPIIYFSINFSLFYFKNIKKQRTDEQIPTPLFTRNNIMDCLDVRKEHLINKNIYFDNFFI